MTIDKVLLTNLYRSGSYSQMDLAKMFYDGDKLGKQKVNQILKYELTGKELHEIKKKVRLNKRIKKANKIIEDES